MFLLTEPLSHTVQSPGKPFPACFLW